jgi:hypothetical protein
MTHKNLIVASEDALGVLFKCLDCDKSVNISKPGLGNPDCSKGADEKWQCPDGIERWIGECKA